MAGCLLSPVRCRLVEASALRDCRFRLVISLFTASSNAQVGSITT
jgi:hypothetical protein